MYIGGMSLKIYKPRFFLSNRSRSWVSGSTTIMQLNSSFEEVLLSSFLLFCSFERDFTNKRS